MSRARTSPGRLSAGGTIRRRQTPISMSRHWEACCRDYADAVLQIATAPVRMLEGNGMLTGRPAVVQIAGQWYLPIDAKYQPAQSHWTQGIYFQSQDWVGLVDMIWLGDPVTQKYLIVRGYDYTQRADGGMKIPTKIEVFQSDPDANIGPRLALVDLKR